MGMAMADGLTEAQHRLVNAVLDMVEGDPGWRHMFIHAEFIGSGPMLRSLVESFVVRQPPDPGGRAPAPVDEPVLAAIEALHAAYDAAGQGFTALDLTVDAPDGRYRFEFGQEPSLRLAGEADPGAIKRLDARYVALARR